MAAAVGALDPSGHAGAGIGPAKGALDDATPKGREYIPPSVQEAWEKQMKGMSRKQLRKM